MTSNGKSNTEMSPMKQALQAIKQLQTRISELENGRNEPIAVVSMACKFPGNINNTRDLWDRLLKSHDAIIEVPANRWNADEFFDPDPEVPGKMYTKLGGFLEEIDQFDPSFFGISPREAASMDPHQRLLLQTTWEAFENGGFDLNKLYGSKTGVYVGISNFEYGANLIWPANPADITSYSGTGGSLGVTAGRLSYTFGFTGPSMIVDTACSSSLVTTHLAIQALRLGECDVAISAGVNLIFGPQTHINFCKAKMLAPDGHCKTFSDDADGYARGEGVGVIVLKRLSDAEKDGDNILALLRGSAINQDGPSGGLTVPNGPSQVKVIKSAINNAAVDPSNIGYIEAHGTGTALGDPIEMSAIEKVFAGSSSKRKHPLQVSSIKTNLGHLESAAGIAGIIKTILIVQNGQIPPHRNFRKPNPHIDWKAFPVEIPLSAKTWSDTDRIAGVSSFSFSGTNSHVIISNYTGTTQQKNISDSDINPISNTKILALSAKHDANLEALAENVAQELATLPQDKWSDYCRSFAIGRGHFAKRLVIKAESPQSASKQLIEKSFQISKKQTQRPRIAFLFTGQGAQFIDMGKQLYEEVPFFRSMMDQCNSIVNPIIGQSLIELIYPKSAEIDKHKLKINQTEYTQPVLFAFEYSLARLWQHLGIEPDAVIGHSLGELVAATISGLFSLEDALELVCARGKLMTELCETGSMASISISESSVMDLLSSTGLDSKLCIATINGPESTVIAGDTGYVNQFIDFADSNGYEIKKLAISHAFHSPLSDPMLETFKKIVGEKSFGNLKIPIISNISGEYADESLVGNASYWADHIRQPVNFNAGMITLIEDGFEVFIEIGPKPILSAFGRDIAGSLGRDTPIRWLPSLRKNIAPFDQIQLGLGELYLLGIDESVSGSLSVGPRYPIQVANTPFITKRYWYSHSDHQKQNRNLIYGHPLLGEHLNSPAINKETNIFRNELTVNSSTFLAHHEVFGEVVLPAAAHLEISIAAANEVLKTSTSVSDITIHSALILPRSKSIQIQTIVRTSQDENEFEIYSKTEGQSDSWSLHSSGKLLSRTIPRPEKLKLSDLKKSHQTEIEVDSYYQSSRELGIAHGEHFQAMKSLHKGLNGYLAELTLPAGVGGITDKSFFIHPVLLDAAFQMASYPLIDLHSSFLPTGVQNLSYFTHLDHTVWCYAKPVTQTLDENLKVYETDLWLLNAEGEVLVKIDKLRFQRVDHKMLPGQRSKIDEWLYEMVWQKSPISGDSAQNLLATNQVVKKLKQKSDDVATEVSFYGELFSQMDQLSSQFIQDALLECGWNPAIGDKFNTSELITICEITQEFQPLFIRSLVILAEDGILKRENDQWEVLHSFKTIDEESVDRTFSQFPQAKSELTLFFRCASKLRTVWQGSVNPLSLLFPESGDSVATLLYKDSIGSKHINELLAEAISNIIDTVPAYKKLRFLEIGGGTGGTTSRILPKLPASQCDYLFTDISAHFTQQATKLYSEKFPFVRYAPLDIEKEPTLENIGYFDVIIAANVVHATQDLTQALANCQKMLAPGGVLVLLEASAKQRWLDLTFGMTDGWWRFVGHDTVRSEYPLLTTESWKSILNQLRFESVTIIGEESKSINEGLRQHVIISQKSRIHQNNNDELSKSIPSNVKEAKENWLVVGKKSELTNQLAKKLGKNCIILDSHDLLSSSESISSISFADFNQLLMVHPLEYGNIDQNAVGSSVMEIQRKILMPVIGIIQLLLKSDPDRLPKLFITTREAVAKFGNFGGLVQSGLIGLVNTIKSEYPEMHPRLIDLPNDSDVAVDIEFILAETQQHTGETQVLFRDQHRWVNRLKRHTVQSNSNIKISADGCYLITGGLGEIGLMTAQFLASKGARNILLMGRKKRTSTADQIIQNLIKDGIKIEIVTGDVSNKKSLQKIIDSIDKDSLKGVIHAAGTLQDGVISSLTWEQMQNVMDAKVSGAWNLHSQTQRFNLDFFILFSSISSVFGPTAQANYATANSFMDQLALARIQTGQPALVINWGAWSDIGLAARHAQQSQVGAMRGIKLIQPEQGIAVFDRIWNQQGQIIAVPVKWPELFTNIIEMPLLSTIQLEMIEKQAQNDESSSWIGELSSLPANKRIEVLTNHVTKQVAKVLGSDVNTLDVTIGFFDLGMDSLTSVELRNALQGSLSIDLPSTLIFKYPTIEAVSEFLAETLVVPLTIEKVSSTSTPKSDVADVSGGKSQFGTSINKDVAEMTEDELNALIDDEFMNLSGDDD